MRILFLCNKSPWPPKEGGPMAMNMLIEGMADAGHKVKVLAVNSYKYNISQSSIPVSYQEKTGIELIDVDLRPKPVDAFLNLFTDESYHVKRFNSASFRKRVIAALSANEYDVVQLETLFMCPYIPAIRAHSRARIVLRAHNIEHLIWQRISEETKNPVKKWYIGHLAGTLKNYEQKIIPSVDGILAITPTDATYFKGLIPEKMPNSSSVIRHSSSVIGSAELRFAPVRHPSFVIDLPFGLDPTKYRDDQRETEFPSLFSLGSMNWIPNHEGLRWFLDQVWPDVHRQFPALKYYIAGREMPGWMKALDLPNVVVLGEVEDASAFIASKAIMIVPLFSGSGIRVKIIEGMAAGKTIITTSIGAEGIEYTNRENILIADAPCEFFEMISLCVTDYEICKKIGKRAMALVETTYNSKNLLQKLLAFYQQLRD
jgi:glycosyltransferase involved in cell wall biosynthesis